MRLATFHQGSSVLKVDPAFFKQAGSDFIQTAACSGRQDTKKRVQRTGRALRGGSRSSLSFSGQREGDHRGRGEDGGHRLRGRLHAEDGHRPDHRLRRGDRGAGLRLHGGEAWGDAFLLC